MELEPMTEFDLIQGNLFKVILTFVLLSVITAGSSAYAQSARLAEVTIALPAKSFQQIIFPLALERGYMKEEGIEVRIIFMEPTPSIQALVADSIQLTAAGVDLGGPRILEKITVKV